jgi:ABC-type spermidine/putrescine transport system permease subunit II
MNLRRLSAVALMAMLLLVALAVVQFAVLTMPAMLVLAARPASEWAGLWSQAVSATVVECNAIAVVTSVLLGLPAALAAWRWRGLWVLVSLLVAPVLVPVALLAGTELTSQGLTVLLVSHASLGLALGCGCALVALQGVEPGLLEAAACAGVGPLAAGRRVVLPLIAPGILAGVLLSGASSMMLSLVSIAMGPPAGYAALSRLTASPILAVIGIALLLCAVVLAAMTLLRR